MSSQTRAADATRGLARAMKRIETMLRPPRPPFRQPTYTVQLHRIVWTGGTWPEGRWEIANSWASFTGLTLKQARVQAMLLRQQNRWASASMSPHVTAICEQTGEPVTEFIP